MSSMKKSKRKKKDRIIDTVLVVVIILLVAGTAASLFLKLQASNDLKNENETVAENRDDFDKLRAINPEVVAWITIDNTSIDFPVLQTTNNSKYLNTNVYGEPAVSGAIFMDYRCSADLSDQYTLIYGHHMRDGNMFSNIDKFKNEKFFESYRTGSFNLPMSQYELRTLSYLEADCRDADFYEPERWTKDNLQSLMSTILAKSIHFSPETAALVEQDPKCKIIVLSTCTAHDENLRSVLVLVASEK